MEALKPGLEFAIKAVVSEENTALKLGSGDMMVFATPAMVAMMENASMNAVRNSLDDGMTTVGTKIGVSHLKATPVGAEVMAKAVLKKVDGRRLVFSVSAYDDSGEIIGEGEHDRFIVGREKFLSKIYG